MRSERHSEIFEHIDKDNNEAFAECINELHGLTPLDDEGYSPFYQVVLKSKEKMLKILRQHHLTKWGKGDLINAVLKNNLQAAELLLGSGISANCSNEQDEKAFDLALTHHFEEMASLLRSHGAYSTLKSQQKQLLQNTSQQENLHQYLVQVQNTSFGPQIEIIETSKGNRESYLKINPWQDAINNTTNKWQILVKKQKCLLFFASETKSKPQALYELQANGKLILHFAYMPHSSLSIQSDAEFELKGCAAVKYMQINTAKCITAKESQLQNGETLWINTKDVDLKGRINFKHVEINAQNQCRHQGELASDNLQMKAANIEQNGKVFVSQNYNAEAICTFNNEGEWIVKETGMIKAHLVRFANKSIIVSQNGEIRIYADSKIENSGAIIGKYVDLEATIINHYHSALIKGLTCLLRAPQVNPSGFVLSGQKGTLDSIDWALNYAHAGVNLLQLSTYFPLPFAVQLRSYLLVAKALHRGGELLYKMWQGKEQEISQGDWINFFLDNVIPSLGVINSQQEKAQLLVNILYHFYGGFRSEAPFLQRSLTIIEALTRIPTLYIGNTKWIELAANMLQSTRYALSLTDVSLSAYQAWQSGDSHAWDNTLTSLQTLAEGTFREVLYSLPPSSLLETNLMLNPRDIALFILNKGHQSELFLQSILFGALHVAKRQRFIGRENGYIELQFCLQIFFKHKIWKNVLAAYENKQMTLSNAISEAIQGIIIILNYYGQKPGREKYLISHFGEKGELCYEEKTEQETIEKQEGNQLFLLEEKREMRSAELLSDEERNAEHAAALKVHEYRVQDYKKEKLTIDLDAITTAIAQRPESKSNLQMFKFAGEALLELQRAIHGEHAANGYLGAFVSALHNEGVLEGGMQGIYVGKGGTNNNAIRASHSIAIYGQFANTFFRNLEAGTMSSQEALYFACLHFVENEGLIISENKIIACATRVIRNYENGQFIAKGDIDILAEVLADNAGVISGAHVRFEGKAEKTRNAGIIIAAKMRLMSEKLVELSESGILETKQVSFESKEILKKGSIRASLVKTQGYNIAQPDVVSWAKGKEETIGALLMVAQDKIKLDKDAFNQAHFVDLHLPSSSENPETILDIDPSFSHMLQIHLPEKNQTLALSQLPKLSSEGTLIVEAPLAKLILRGEGSYPNTLRFIGEECDYSKAKVDFQNPLLLDVTKLKGALASGSLQLNKGGFIQADSFQNYAEINSGDILHWNVRHFQNEAQLETKKEYFKHSTRFPIYQECESTQITAGSGKIYAKGHRGYLGKIHQHGGKILSGKEGMLAYYEEGENEAILTLQGENPTTDVHDTGPNWYKKPVWQNSAIGSDGKLVLIGKKAMTCKGLSLWGREGAYHNAEKGSIANEVKYARYEIKPILSLSKKNKVKKVIIPHTIGFTPTQNDISADEGLVTLVAQDGSISLENTVISAANDISLIAKEKVALAGVSTEQIQEISYKNKGFFGSKRYQSTTTGNHIYSSFIFSGGELVIRAKAFELGAVQGAIADADILAETTTFKGKEERQDSFSLTNEFKIGVTGIDNLLNVLNGHNAKAVFRSFMNACGWDQTELETLLKVDNLKDLPKPLLNVARNAWNITALVAHACKEYGESPEAFISEFTDKMGITQFDGVKRSFNPEFTFNYKKQTEETHQIHTVPTSLTVGGRFLIRGKELHLLDGSNVDAAHLRLFLSKGIYGTKGLDIYRQSKKTKKIVPAINITNLKDIGFQLGKETQQQEIATLHLARLHARDSAVVKAGQEIAGEIVLSGDRGGEIVAPTMRFESAQSISKIYSKEVQFSVNPRKMGGSFMKQRAFVSQTQRAGIHFPEAAVLANEVELMNGAKIHSATLFREDGKEGLPSVVGTSIRDLASDKSLTFSAKGVRKGGPAAHVVKKHTEKIVMQRPTILAKNIEAKDFPEINKIAANESNMEGEKQSGYSLGGFWPRLEKHTQEVKDIKGHDQKGVEQHQESQKNDKSLPLVPDKKAVAKSRPSEPQKHVAITSNPTFEEVFARQIKDLKKAGEGFKAKLPEPSARLMPLRQEKSSNLSMLWRAFRREDSAAIRAWQNKNRKSIPRDVQKVVDGVSMQREAVNSAITKGRDLLKEKIDHPIAEVLVEKYIPKSMEDIGKLLFYRAVGLSLKGLKDNKTEVEKTTKEHKEGTLKPAS